MEWPVVAGRYVVGNPCSSVAICTLYSLDLIDKLASELGNENFAIIGKVVTENIGVERIIRNIISNPNIKFLVICGEEPHGHWVGQALKCLKENGIDEERKIIGAKGAMPYLRNLSDTEIEEFRKRIEIIDLIGSEDVSKIKSVVMKLNSKKTDDSISSITIPVKEEIETIIASHDDIKEFVRDPNGWFIIDIDREKNEIVLEHYVGYDSEAKLHCKIRGKNAHEICATIARLGLISRLDHACYLGRELQKAEIALKLNIPYEQDKDLKFE
jgi:tetrahydromethanopterin S-methyltransferase subunit A